MYLTLEISLPMSTEIVNTEIYPDNTLVGVGWITRTNVGEFP